MTLAVTEEILSQNDVLGLNSEYDRWLARAAGLSFPRGVTPFDAFCAEQFLKPHVLLSDQDILSGLVGKSDDSGLDGFYFILNGALVDDSTEIPAQQGQSVHLVLL